MHEYLDARTVLAEAQLAERLGYASVWFGDSQLIWRELYGLLGAAAATTARIKLGTGVTNPVTRHPAVTASAIATVQELSAGRAILGISVGDTALKSMGLGPTTRAELTRYVQIVRALGQGDTVQGPSGEMRLAYAAATTPAPIVIGASGPKMLHLAGEIGDGVVITREARAGPTLTAMLRCVADGRAAAGRGRPVHDLRVRLGCRTRRPRQGAAGRAIPRRLDPAPRPLAAERAGASRLRGVECRLQRRRAHDSAGPTC